MRDERRQEAVSRPNRREPLGQIGSEVHKALAFRADM
jgi:hypothetical protein